MNFRLAQGFSFLLLLLPMTIIGQTKDDTLVVQVSRSQSDLNFKDLSYFDLDGFQHYRPFGQNRLPIARSGNIGLPVHFYDLTNQRWSINHLLGGFQPYLITKDSMRYYKMSRPFTELKYMNGAESEQYFTAFHSQNLGEGLNVSFEYNRIVSEAYFLNQLTSHTQFRSSYLFQSRDKRFQSKGYFFINNLEAQENGGVFVTPNEDPDDNTALLNISLPASQNRLRSQGVGFENSYSIWMKDSVTSLIRFSHELDWNKAFKNYTDDNGSGSDFYRNSFLDTLNFTDTTYAEELSNHFKLFILSNKVSAGFKIKTYDYFQNTLINERLNSTFITANYSDSIAGLGLSGTFEKGLSGFYRDDFLFSAKAAYFLFNRLKSELSLFAEKRQADFFVGNQRTNHFSFANKFDASSSNGLSINIEDEKTKVRINVRYANFANFIYYDSLVIPQQLSNNINQVELRISKTFHFLKHWYLLNKLVFQQFSEEEIIPLPALFSFHSLYYQNTFFKNTLKLQLGADLYYISDYSGYAYSPAMSQFHLRNSSQALGAIHQLDVFLNLQINKSARIFGKMENVLSNAYSEDSERVENYPIPGRSIKVGFSWRMVN